MLYTCIIPTQKAYTNLEHCDLEQIQNSIYTLINPLNRNRNLELFFFFHRFSFFFFFYYYYFFFFCIDFPFFFFFFFIGFPLKYLYSARYQYKPELEL